MKHMNTLTLTTVAAAALLTACSGGSGTSGASNGLSAASQEPISITAENKDQVAASAQQAVSYAEVGVGFADSFAGAGAASDKKSPLITEGCDSGSYSESGNSATFDNCEFSFGGNTLRVDGSLTVTESSATFDELTYEVISNTGSESVNSVLVFDGSIDYEESGSSETYTYNDFVISAEADVDSGGQSFSYSAFYALDGSFGWTETATGEEESFDLTFSFDFQSDDIDREAAGGFLVGSIDLTSDPDIFTADSDSYPSEGKLIVSGSGSSNLTIEFGVCPVGQASISVNGGAAACEGYTYF